MSRAKHLLRGAVLPACLVASSPVVAGEYMPWELNDRAEYTLSTPLPSIENRVDRVKGNWRHFTRFASWSSLWLGSDTDDERLELLNPRTGQRELLTDFKRQVGFTRFISLPPCNVGRVHIVSKNQQLDTPAGLFADVVQLQLQTSCADGGVTAMWFAPGVGLVQWAEDSLAGERLYRLAEGRIDDRSYPADRGLVVTGGMPAGKVWVNVMPPVNEPTRIPVSLALRNQGAEALTYQFNSGQRYDILLLDGSGEVVAQWSHGKAFPEVLGRLILQPGDSVRFQDMLALLTMAGGTVPPGNYTLEMRLASYATPDTAHLPGSGPPAVQVPLEVGWAF